MADSTNIHPGLQDEAVFAARQKHGSNIIPLKEDKVLLRVLKEVVLEPMFLLLLAACAIYFLLRQYEEGFIMLVAICIVAGISFYQEFRSRNAVQALRRLSAAKARVIRNSTEQEIAIEEIVVGDVLLLAEGEVIAADGKLLSANDFSVNESLLTGEAFPVEKDAENSGNVYKGTLVVSGSAIAEVTDVGLGTMFGKIGLSMQDVQEVHTPLQMQVRSFVRNMVWFGVIAFLLVAVYNYFLSGSIITALLQGLTLAMSVLPEEIPVAFSTFLALGAYRLLKYNIIVKQPQHVETLGSATVICCDKTGTITQNKMEIATVYDAATRQLYPADTAQLQQSPVIAYGMWASETAPFDPMETAIHRLYDKTAQVDERLLYQQVHEYPISGKPPLMTHIFSNASGNRIIACKGAPEAILAQTMLSQEEQQAIEQQALALAREGYRVLGVGRGIWNEPHYPVLQTEFVFEFLGLIAFSDPPKPNMRQTIATFRNAGIQVKMITGDYAETAMAIAGQIDLDGNKHYLTGNEILLLDTPTLQHKVKQVHVFARMFPEAKLKVINALKENGEVVAMTGDGVNDGPALKAAHIGIAMGKRGSEVAKSAASLILIDDDLGHMTDAIALGRKIYNNLQKAIRYIVSIHIPIILVVMLPLLLQWPYTAFFTPVHVIFLELIMGPTCSIIYENEPADPNLMLVPPRQPSVTFFTARQLLVSIMQGLLITAGCLGIGYWLMHYTDAALPLVRTVIFITLLMSNIFLTLVNRSFTYTMFTTIRYKNPLVLMITGVTLVFIVLLQTVPAIREVFGLVMLSRAQILSCLFTAMAATCWIDVLKAFRKK